MSRSTKISYSIVALAILAFAVNIPGIVQGQKQRRDVDAAFDAYAHALVSGDYVRAYQLCGDAFTSSTSFESFVGKQLELHSRFGPLKAVNNKGTYVHGKGSPMGWTAVIEAQQVYEKREIHSVCEFHLENNGWRLFGCKQV